MPAQRNNNRNKRGRRAVNPRGRGNVVQKPEKDNTVADWQKLGKEVLRLKCLEFILPDGGNKQELACRLHTHFHPVPAGGTDDDEDPDAVLNRRPDEIIRAEDDPPENIVRPAAEPNATNESGNTDSTVAWDEAGGGANDDSNSTAAMSADDVSKLVHNAVADAIGALSQGLIEELRVARDRATEAESAAEITALRSQIERTRQQEDPPAPSPQSRQVTFARTDQGDQRNPGNQVANSNVPQPPGPLPVAPTVRNPFPIPSLLQRDLLAIQKGDYVDFDKIKPKKWGERHNEDSEDGFGVTMTVVEDNGDGTESIRFKKKSETKIENFPEWLEVWNKFMAARLHFHPTEQADLMFYQRSITHLARRYKFSAVYNYDIDFRRKMAGERFLGDPLDRTVFWGVENVEMKNENLFGEHLPPVYCYNCHTKGHLTHKCTKPFSGGGNGPNAPYNAYGHQEEQMYMQYPNYSQQGPRRGNFRQQNQFQGQARSQIQQASGPRFRNPRPATGNGPPTAGNINGRGSGFCNTWNHRGFCWRGQTCRFRHVCNRCQEDNHGGINCMANTSSSYRPRF